MADAVRAAFKKLAKHAIKAEEARQGLYSNDFDERSDARDDFAGALEYAFDEKAPNYEDMSAVKNCADRMRLFYHSAVTQVFEREREEIIKTLKDSHLERFALMADPVFVRGNGGHNAIVAADLKLREYEAMGQRAQKDYGSVVNKIADLAVKKVLRAMKKAANGARIDDQIVRLVIDSTVARVYGDVQEGMRILSDEIGKVREEFKKHISGGRLVKYAKTNLLEVGKDARDTAGLFRAAQVVYRAIKSEDDKEQDDKRSFHDQKIKDSGDHPWLAQRAA